jgi:predicted NAD-dependent protein-ADP-ribosyltransferase YbiA (DUF1768 family)
LIQTGSRRIVSIDDDTFWGMKYDETLDKLVGQNKTGEILMKVRAKLHSEKHPEA